MNIKLIIILGRIGNEWLCADGAAMFNLNLNVPFQSNLGRSIVLLQHLMAVSICNSISQLSPDFPIKIKWPNDLYYGRISKLGGVLVRTSQSESDQKYSCLIGLILFF
jgi:biotin---protein ligase